MTRYNQMKNIMKTHQAHKVEGLTVDVESAHYYIEMFNKSSQSVKVMLETEDLGAILEVCKKVLV